MIQFLRRNLLAFTGLLNTAFLAILGLAFAFDWWVWSGDQQGAVLVAWSVVMAGLTFAFTGKTSLAVTPVADPRDNDGNALTPAAFPGASYTYVTSTDGGGGDDRNINYVDLEGGETYIPLAGTDEDGAGDPLPEHGGES